MKKNRTYGFRFSYGDGFVLLLALGVSIGGQDFRPFIWFVPFVVGHFFLFCNIFRIRRKAELIWSFLFLSQIFLGIYGHFWTLETSFIGQLIITLMILCYEIQQPYYHGIFARRWNPYLDDYLLLRV